MIEHDKMLDSVAAYALGALSPQEAQIVAEHLRTCEQCSEEYRLLRPAVTAVAHSAEAHTDSRSGAVAASPLLKARVMREVRRETERRARPRGWPTWALLAACLALALLSYSLSRQLNHDRTLATAQDQTIADLAAADAQRYRFSGGSVVTHEDRLYIVLQNLPTPPSGKIYQAWTLAKGQHRVAPSVTFAPGGSTTVVRLPEAAAGIAAVAVSVEPEGGSTQPTTKPIAVVTI
jgi:anti-sigma-K factor RskA